MPDIRKAWILAVIFSLSGCDNEQKSAANPVEMVEVKTKITMNVDAVNARIDGLIKSGEGYYDPVTRRYMKAEDAVNAFAAIMALEYEHSYWVDVKMDPEGKVSEMDVYIEEMKPKAEVVTQGQAPAPATPE
jgi:hypothetical protein